MDGALTGSKPQANSLVTKSATHDLFRAKVRAVSSIVGGAAAHAEDLVSTDETTDSNGTERPHSLTHREQLARESAAEMYARFNTNEDGLDRSQVIAALKSSGVDARGTYIDVAFAKCDVCGIGRLDEQSFSKLWSILQSHKARHEQRKAFQHELSKEVEQRAAAEALPGYVVNSRDQ